MTLTRIVTAVAALVVLSAACSDQAEPTEPPPTADAVLAAAGEAMATVESVRFQLQHSGAPVYIDSLGLLAFEEASGRFVAPSSADALVTLTVPGNLTTQIGAVAIDGTTWLSNPITGEFEDAPAGYAFDPATLFDPDLGLQPLFADLRNVELVGEEERPDGRVYHVRGLADASRVEVITAGLVKNQDVELDLWLDSATGALIEAEFTTTHQGETSVWQLALSDYGAEFEIEPPARG